MISVHASEADHAVVREFFELFKTPWQFHAPGATAKILICTRPEIPANNAALVILFSGATIPFDQNAGEICDPKTEPLWFQHEEIELPVYGRRLVEPASRKIIFRSGGENGKNFARVGFDLFSEVRHLLTAGQPEAFAAVPALERHIAFLRNLILRHGLPLVEIPPRPAGHEFIACLTHDVDHVGIRNHKFDHTMFGFLFRATLGSLPDAARGKKTFGQLAENWLAVLKLPFVHLGLAGDFWYQFENYVALEGGRPSTFFVIPKKGETGLDAGGNRPAKRAASYDARDLKDILRGLKSSGKEIGVHGLDAWRDAAAGRDEKKIISEITGATESGVRMHWLYFGAQSPAELEQAGFTYDSTCGYNGTVGYRAGATQVFKPLTAKNLLELPMHVMDTALFYPSYLNLSPEQAEEKIRPFVANANQFGGALTVNWHDRSLAPERLWGGTYRWLLEEFKTQGAWFATAAQTVAWFRKRRAATFDSTAGGQIKIKSIEGVENLPALRVRIFSPNAGGGKFVEKLLGDGEEICLAA
jgi:hypothetical protein